MTARQLYDALTDAGVALSVDGSELVLAGVIPANLDPLIDVLQTGLRAMVSERKWWASSSDRPRIEAISASLPIPEWVGLLCVEGDGTADASWDRIRPDARIDHPEIFEMPAAKQAA